MHDDNVSGLLTSQLSQDGDNSVLIEMKTDTVIILSSLCEHDLHRKVCSVLYMCVCTTVNVHLFLFIFLSQTLCLCTLFRSCSVVLVVSKPSYLT